MIQSVNDLKVYKKAKQLAMQIFELSKSFPNEEKYSLTDQIIRSSRSVSANIREGYAKRKYKNVFIRHLVDSLGSSEETREWIDYAFNCSYISEKKKNELDQAYDEFNAML